MLPPASVERNASERPSGRPDRVAAVIDSADGGRPLSLAAPVSDPHAASQVEFAERESVAVRSPGRQCLLLRRVRHGFDPAVFDPLDIDVARSRPPGMEGEGLAVRRRRRREIVGGIGRQPLRFSTGRGNAKDVVVAREVGIVVQPLSVLRRPKLLDVFVGVGDPRCRGRRCAGPGGYRDGPGARPRSVQRVRELRAGSGDRNRVRSEADAQADRWLRRPFRHS